MQFCSFTFVTVQTSMRNNVPQNNLSTTSSRSRSRFQGRQQSTPSVVTRGQIPPRSLTQSSPVNQSVQSGLQPSQVQQILLPISSSNLVRSEDGQLALPLQITLNEDGSTGFLAFPRPGAQSGSRYRV